MSDDAPRISVVIPAYNAASFIRRAIHSTLVQTLAPYEIIVVDDGSKDGTAEFVERNYPAVRVFRQHNAGPGAARNHGVREASGDWIGLLDADDMWLPEKLERQAPFTTDPKVAIVHATEVGPEETPDRVTFESLWQRNCILNSSVLVRRATWESVGGCDEDRTVISVEDYNLWLRIAAAGWDIVTCREDLTVYICEVGHLTSRYEKYSRAEIANVDRIASQLNLEPGRLEEKRIRTYDEQGRLLLYNRCIGPARELLFHALRRSPTTARLGWWLASCLPKPLLEARRAARERAFAALAASETRGLLPRAGSGIL